MKSYIFCLAIVLSACSSAEEKDIDVNSNNAPAPTTVGLSPNLPYESLCDRPTRYTQITLPDGRSVTIPFYVMCNSIVPGPDRGDPSPEKIDNKLDKVGNPLPTKK
jgi:hypothetical protein